MPRVVFFTSLPQDIAQHIVGHAPAGFEVAVHPLRLPEERQVALVRDADFLMLFPGVVSDAVLRAAAGVKLVQVLSAGYDRVNLALAQELGVPVANNGGANAVSVAEHAIMLMLALFKRLVPCAEATRAGGWHEEAGLTGSNIFELAEKAVGIVGMGQIGRAVAQRLRAFECRLQYYDPYPLSPEEEARYGVRPVGLEELLRTSDVVTLHTPLTRETRGLMNRERLALMQPSAILINTSRGGVVDEAALVEALRAGRPAAAGLDVLEQEPPAPDHPLLRLPNVVVTPHSAGRAWDTWGRRARNAFQNMLGVWQGQPPRYVARFA